MKLRTSARLSQVSVTPKAVSEDLFLEAVSSIRPEDIPQKDADHLATHEKRSRNDTSGWIRKTVDLHGMTTDQALQYLRDCLVALRGEGGAVRVIVGKGLHSPDGVGVLRDVVQAWFVHGGKPFVSGWKWAGKKEGGSGVIIARLRAAAETKEP